MLEITIPGFGLAKLEHLVSDYTGTLSIDGTLIPGVKEQLNNIAQFLSVHIVTADTFGTARKDHIFAFLGTQQRKALFSQNPTNGIRHIRFATSIWADDSGDATLKRKRDLGGKCFIS